MQNYKLQAETPEFDLKGNLQYYSVPACSLISAKLKPWDFTVYQNGKAVLTITADGELIITNGCCATEVTDALYAAWQATLGRHVGH